MSEQENDQTLKIHKFQTSSIDSSISPNHFPISPISPISSIQQVNILPTVGMKVVTNYLLEEEIGRGSFATVHRGQHLENSQIVAIKIIPLAKLTRKLISNLQSEIKILQEMATLAHPYIVNLIAWEQTEKAVLLVMDWCSFGDLSLLLRKATKRVGAPLASYFNLSNVIRNLSKDTFKNLLVPQDLPFAGLWGGFHPIFVTHFIGQLTCALQFLNQHQFMHRDIKPQNLLLHPSSKHVDFLNYQSVPLFNSFDLYLSENSPLLFLPCDSSHYLALQLLPYAPTLKLADFGFARHLPTPTSMAETLCGSPLYMAPEILRYEKYDAKADLWSVGAVLYELLFGRVPFRASNHIELLKKIEKGADRIRFPKGALGPELIPVRIDHINIQPSAHGISQSAPPVITPIKKILTDQESHSLSMSAIKRTSSDEDYTLGAEDVDLISRLLKQNPSDRMSLEEFFLHPVITNSRDLSDAISSWRLNKPRFISSKKPTNPSSVVRVGLSTPRTSLAESNSLHFKPSAPIPISGTASRFGQLNINPLSVVGTLARGQPGGTGLAIGLATTSPSPPFGAIPMSMPAQVVRTTMPTVLNSTTSPNPSRRVSYQSQDRQGKNRSAQSLNRNNSQVSTQQSSKVSSNTLSSSVQDSPPNLPSNLLSPPSSTPNSNNQAPTKANTQLTKTLSLGQIMLSRHSGSVSSSSHVPNPSNSIVLDDRDYIMVDDHDLDMPSVLNSTMKLDHHAHHDYRYDYNSGSVSSSPSSTSILHPPSTVARRASVSLMGFVGKIINTTASAVTTARKASTSLTSSTLSNSSSTIHESISHTPSTRPTIPSSNKGSISSSNRDVPWHNLKRQSGIEIPSFTPPTATNPQIVGIVSQLEHYAKLAWSLSSLIVQPRNGILRREWEATIALEARAACHHALDIITNAIDLVKSFLATTTKSDPQTMPETVQIQTESLLFLSFSLRNACSH